MSQVPNGVNYQQNPQKIKKRQTLHRKKKKKNSFVEGDERI